MSKCQLIRFTVLTEGVVFHDISYSFLFLHLYQCTEKLLANLSETAPYTLHFQMGRNCFIRQRILSFQM